MAITAKELLNLKLDGFSTLKDVFYMYEGEGQFPQCEKMTEEQEEEFYEQLAQQIIHAVLRGTA
jgi:hypothetical protein